MTDSSTTFFVKGCYAYLSFHLNIFDKRLLHLFIVLCSRSTTIGTVNSEALTWIISSSCNSNRVEPSRLTQAELRLSYGLRSVINVDDGTTKGRQAKACGANGVTHIESELGCKTDPPAARLYAEEPVGVLTITPLPITFVMYYPSR